jgi:uncharacterized membrane protein
MMREPQAIARRSGKDRMRAEHDYEVNVKAELGIMLLQEKFDQLRQQHWSEILALQHRQMHHLAELRARAEQTCPALGARAPRLAKDRGISARSPVRKRRRRAPARAATSTAPSPCC